MDNKINESNESNGGSGKSFCLRALKNLLQTVTLPGKNKKLTEGQFIYERVTEYTDLVLLDDADEYFDFNFFFDVITGDMVVNPKQTKSYEISFEQSPKFAITSNYTLRNFDPSTERRILYTVFSDYYHQKSENNDYNETVTIASDFDNKNIMLSDYSTEDWNNDFNFFADCLEFYLSTIDKNIKIQPPMEKVVKRNLITVMTETFKDWAEVYFSPESGNLNILLNRKDLFNQFVIDTGNKNWKMKKFTNSIKAFVKYSQYIEEINPKILMNKDNRLIRKDLSNNACEMIYLKEFGKSINPSLIV